MRKVLILPMLLLAAAACRDNAPAPRETASAESAPSSVPAADAAPLPEEAARLVQRVAACEHFAGEEPYDAARGHELREQVESTCPGNAAELKRLREKYARDGAVMQVLSALDPPEM